MAQLAQLQKLQQENAQLQAALAAKEGDLAAMVEATADLQSQDVQAAKIIELSKKNRALNLALEREKQRAAKLEKDLAAAGSSSSGSSSAAASAAPGAPNADAIEKIARGMVEQAAEAAEAAQKEATQWKEKLQQTANKTSQLEQKVSMLESENKKLVRALQREVGDDVPLSKLLDEGSDWKGRREQLIALRDQVRQLKTAAGTVPENRQDVAAKNAISNISKARSAEQERLAAELAATKGELDSLKLKHDAAISRRKILENDLTVMKQKVSVVLEKTQTDDRLIAALKAELAQARRGAAPLAPGLKTDDELWGELGALRRRVAEQEEQVDRQEAIIVALQQRIQQGGGQGAMAAPSPPPQVQMLQQQQQSGLDAQHARLLEVENARLQELVGLLKAKLDVRVGEY